ncbi:hypothetical protein F511_32371 [Dorcoceras hygrometricum]|uniref:Uncharacterized protein n=1 Tax=Dorcoceras hygrometricum TaxID=472368 RepID=A0A2Z7AP67_9LAMI|nr:hypothetical protein F511_32371 [Dorcoceras hygrometricum]
MKIARRKGARAAATRAALHVDVVRQATRRSCAFQRPTSARDARPARNHSAASPARSGAPTSRNSSRPSSASNACSSGHHRRNASGSGASSLQLGAARALPLCATKNAASATPRRAPCTASAQASRALVRAVVKMGRRHARRRRGRFDDEISSF